MDEMEEKLSAILGNPQLMNQIMSMAQAFSQQTPNTGDPPASKPQPPQQASQPPKQASQPQNKSTPSPGKNEIEIIRRLSAFAQQSGLDRQQQNLIKALQPYLGRDRLSKLEKAMQAAKLARFASSAIEHNGNQSKSGR